MPTSLSVVFDIFMGRFGLIKTIVAKQQPPKECSDLKKAGNTKATALRMKRLPGGSSRLSWWHRCRSVSLTSSWAPGPKPSVKPISNCRAEFPTRRERSPERTSAQTQQRPCEARYFFTFYILSVSLSPHHEREVLHYV